MKSEHSSVVIRHIRSEDVPNVRILCRILHEKASMDMIIEDLTKFMFHPYLHLLILVWPCLIAYSLELGMWTSTAVALLCILLLEGSKFYIYWKRMICVFRKGPDLQNPIAYCSHPKRFFLVAETGDHNIVGTVAIGDTDQPRTASLSRMFVTQDHRRKGIASKLLAECHAECKKLGYASVLLTTRTSNKSAIECYERAGYSVTGTEDTALLYPHCFKSHVIAKDLLNTAGVN